MSSSRFERGRGLPAAVPERGLLSSALQPRKRNRAVLRAIRKETVPVSALLALALGFPAACYAQEAQPAADQQHVSTLPPVSVVQPKTLTPASQPRPRSETGGGTSGATESGQQTAVSGPVTPGAGGAAQTGVFGLGGINLMGGTVITNDQTWYFAKHNVTEAAIDLAPGVHRLAFRRPSQRGAHLRARF